MEIIMSPIDIAVIILAVIIMAVFIRTAFKKKKGGCTGCKSCPYGNNKEHCEGCDKR